VGEYKGVKLLAVWTHGPGQMFTKKPMKSLAEFKNQKIRTGGGIAEAVANALGASAFVKPAPSPTSCSTRAWRTACSSRSSRSSRSSSTR
jgi:hypothetical protein